MGKSSRPLVLLPQFCSVAKFYKEVNGEVARASQVSAVSLLAGGCIRDLSGSPVKSLPYLSQGGYYPHQFTWKMQQGRTCHSGRNTWKRDCKSAAFCDLTAVKRSRDVQGPNSLQHITLGEGRAAFHPLRQP